MAKGTARQVKAQLGRDVARAEHRKRLAKLRAIRGELRGIKERKRELVKRTRAACKLSRVRARAAAKAYRAAEHERIRREVRELVQAERNRCAARVVTVKAGAAKQVQAKQIEAARLRDTDRIRRAATEHGKKERERVTARERMAESDDAVRDNIDTELHPIFDKVRKQIHAAPGRSRTEAFLEWVEGHPEEVWTMRADASDRKVAQLVREEAEAHRETMRAAKAAAKAQAKLAACGGACAQPATRRARRADLEAAPF